MLKISPSKRLWAAGVKTMSKLSPQLTGPNPMDTLTLSVEFFFFVFHETGTGLQKLPGLFGDFNALFFRVSSFCGSKMNITDITDTTTDILHVAVTQQFLFTSQQAWDISL